MSPETFHSSQMTKYMQELHKIFFLLFKRVPVTLQNPQCVKCKKFCLDISLQKEIFAGSVGSKGRSLLISSLTSKKNLINMHLIYSILQVMLYHCPGAASNN